MKTSLLLVLFPVLLAAQTSTIRPPTAEADRANRHEFAIANFRIENGITLPQMRVVYGTYGHLSAARNNAVLLPSHYMANFHGYEGLHKPRPCA